MSEEAKTLPAKGKGADQPPRTCDPATAEILGRCQDCGVETTFDR